MCSSQCPPGSQERDSASPDHVITLPNRHFQPGTRPACSIHPCARGLDLDLPLIVVASLGLTIAYLLWWTYFAGDDDAAERALEAVGPRERARLAVRAYALAFYFLLLGIVVVAAGIKKATEYADGHLASRRTRC